jgi:hypothetical protein
VRRDADVVGHWLRENEVVPDFGYFPTAYQWDLTFTGYDEPDGYRITNLRPRRSIQSNTHDAVVHAKHLTC